MEVRKPLLAATIESPEDLKLVKFPVYVSPKIDGFRGMTNSLGEPHTRKGEPFKNPDFNAAMKVFKQPNLDFEIGIGPAVKNKKFFTLTSGWLRSEDEGVPVPDYPNKVHDQTPVTLYIFDKIIPGMTFDERWQKNRTPSEGFYNLKISSGYLTIEVKWVPQILIHTIEEFWEWEQKFYDAGWEGIMIRGSLARGQYKHGRSTMNSQELMKYKRFKDEEATITGFEEQETNTNEKKVDALGHSKRSSAKAGKVPNGHAGKLIVSCPSFKEPVKIGTGLGLTKALRKHMWENQDQYIGRTITFWHQPGSDYVKARFPSFKGFRDDGL